MLTAYAVGVEVATQVARAVNFVHYDKGWHPTATLGVFGAAAGGARVLGLSVEETTTAVSYATAFSAGLKSSFGTLAKPVQVGRASMGGTTAALLASVGASANPGAFEARQGFATVFNGAGLFDLDAATVHLADPWDLEEPGIALKRHPCCGGTHAAVDASLALRDRIALDEVERIDVFVHPARYAHLDRPAIGPDPLEAKFSLQYTTALALVHGEVALDHFSLAVLDDPRIVSVRDRVVAHPLPDDRTGPERFAAEVHVALHDGTSVVERLERPVGRTPETALTDADVEAKFRMCTRTRLSEAAQSEVAEIVWTLEEQSDVRRLCALLRGEA
jgi:2-methylcitrate dehydratase PrpD